jgi:tetratricopeptide (TPR) repeat protein
MKPLQISLLLLGAALAACVPARGTREGYETGDRPATQSPYPGLPPYRVSSGALPRNAEEISGPAVLSLLNQARGDLASGRPELAEASLERAQRIEPRNPFIWQQLATMHLAQKRMLEAENMAQRSNSLARGNPYIEMENWRMIATARLARGDKPGFDEAEARIAQMQEALD